LAVAIASSLAACGATKTSQCNSLSSAVNKIRPIAEKIQQEVKSFESAAKTAGAKNDLKAFKEAAAKSSKSFTTLIGQLDGLIQEIQGVELKDEKLVELKKQYVKNATSINTAFKDTSKALDNISKIDNSPKGLQELKQSANILAQNASRMNGLAKEESKMVADFNGYCGAGGATK
jgi:chromosome segregation ATPase